MRSSRIESIDILRGIVMVLMALDHVRDYFHVGSNVDDPLNLATTTPLLFFTRWITHFCAPVFVFLSGTSIYLQSQRKSKDELGMFLLKRGLWLIFAEWVIVAFAWTFNPYYNVIPFQVIWAIGISMVIMGILTLLKLPYKGMLILGFAIVFGHNLLDFVEASPGFTSSFWWDLIHGKFVPHEYAPGHVALLVYPFPAWTGLMMLGYCLGKLFTKRFTPPERRKILIRTGLGVILLFIILRFTNMYGDPIDWTIQKNILFTFLSFIKAEKYPPSLLYLCMTIGPALILLALTEGIRNKFTKVMIVFGRTAFFYYVIHIYLIHALTTVAFFMRGHTFAEATNIGERYPFLFVIPGEGFGLTGVYLVWLFIIVALYPLCKSYDRYKTAHREKWWLSYL